MKRVLVPTLIVNLAGAVLPAAAQDSLDEPTSGPIAQAVTREAVRLAPEPAWSGVQPASGTAESDWSRVRKLRAGTEVVVTDRGSQPGTRYFVRADQADLTVLNLTDPTLPRAALRVLLDMASNRSEYLTSQKGTFVDKEVRVGPDGVFVADRKVADLQQVVETSARTRVAEIEIRQKGRGAWGHLGSLGGYFVGAMSGGVVAAFACQAAVGRDRCDTGAFLTGALVGGIAGGVHGFRAANRETEDVIYRAP